MASPILLVYVTSYCCIIIFSANLTMQYSGVYKLLPTSLYNIPVVSDILLPTSEYSIPKCVCDTATNISLWYINLLEPEF
jgi:hypothetical protein